MAKSYEELELEQKNETEFVLSKTEQDGTKREFLLSETDVVLLGRVVPSIVRQINAGKSPGFGILARPAAPMTEALLNIDLEERLVLLRIRDAWEGKGYRWFRSPNILPIEQWRRRVSVVRDFETGGILI